MDKASITPAEAAWAADCRPSTLRAWHNRLGLLPREDGGKWRRYTITEVLQIRVVVVLTERNIEASHAVEIANGMKKFAEQNLQGLRSQVAFGRQANGDGYEVREMPSFEDWNKPYRFTDALAWFDDPLFHILDLGRLAVEVRFRLAEARSMGV